MVRLEVNDEVAVALDQQTDTVEVVNRQGKRLGFIGTNVSEVEIAEARRVLQTECGGSTIDEFWDGIQCDLRPE